MKPQKLAMLCLLILLLSGCIRTKAVITSDPPAAEVYWNEKYRGRTPIEIPYIWNWKYTVQLVREGYEPSNDVVRMRAKPWLIFPLDLIAEALPFKITDTKKLHYAMKPASELPATQPVEINATDLLQ